MISNQQIKQLLIDYNLDTINISIKCKADYSIIGIVWFVTIKGNNITSYGQSQFKQAAITIAIKNLSEKILKK